MRPYKNLVFGGGAMHGCMYPGVLIALCNGDRDAYAAWFKGVNCVAGTSVGSIFAYMLTVWDPWTVCEKIKTCGFRDIAATLFDHNVAEATMQRSINSGRALEAMLKRGVLESLGDEGATLLDLYKRTGKKLVITVTDRQSGRVGFWNYTNRPELPI